MRQARQGSPDRGLPQGDPGSHLHATTDKRSRHGGKGSESIPEHLSTRQRWQRQKEKQVQVQVQGGLRVLLKLPDMQAEILSFIVPYFLLEYL